jgi:hypothetical protein
MKILLSNLFFLLSYIFTKNSNITLDIFKQDNRYYTTIGLGTPVQNFTVLITTKDLYSTIPIFSNFENRLIYNNNDSETFSTNLIFEYQNHISGELSYDTLLIENNTIQEYGFLYTQKDVPKISLARENFSKEDFNLLDMLRSDNLIHNKKLLLYGDKLYIDQEIINTEEFANNTFCNLFAVDEVFSTKWACNLSHLYYGNEIENFANSFAINEKAVFDIGEKYVILPKAISGVNTWGFIYNYIFDAKSESHECIEEDIHNYTHIKCKSDLDELEFLKQINYKPLYFIFNGYGYPLNPPFEKFENTYTFNIILSPDHEYIIGNSLLNNFKSLYLNEEEMKVRFYDYKTILNATEFTRDILEEPEISFFIFSIVCVVLLLLLIISIPYIMYRQRQRTMMEKMYYDIVVFRKLNDITREVAK